MIYENISRLCAEKGTSIWAVEKELGIANGTIGKWKISVPRLDTAKKVANHLGVTVDELMETKEEQNEDH